MSRKSIAVLASGGLDSCALLADMANTHATVWPIYIRQGLTWEKAELQALQAFLRKAKRPAFQPMVVLDLPMTDVYGAHWSTGRKPVPGARTRDASVYLPGRNLALILKAAVFCVAKKIPEVAIGSLGHNPFPDATPGFFRSYSRTLCMGLGRPIRLSAPYRTQSKADVIRHHADVPLHWSLSCISPRGNRHCGRCNKCAERQKAYKQSGVHDQTRYVR